MARTAKKETVLTLEEKLAQALVPEEEQPHRVPENWCWTKIGVLSTLHRGVSYKKNDAHSVKQENDCLVMRGGNIGEGYIDIDADNVYVDFRLVSKAQLVKKNDIIIVASTGSTKVIGRAGISYDDYSDVAFGAFLMAVRPNQKVVPRYMDYFFQSDLYRNRIRDLASGVNINNIRAEYITETPYPLPPLEEQQRIVDRIESLFGKLDEAKEKAQAVVDGFEDRKAAILHKAFTGEIIGLSNSNTVPLAAIVDTIKIGPFGSALHKEDYVFSGVPVINPKHIVNQQIVSEAKVTITNEKADELCNYRLKTGDIIMGRRGEMGRSAPVTEKENGWICGTGSLIVRLQEGYDASFYSQIIASHASVQFLEENCVGSTMSNLNEKIVKILPVPYYSKEEQHLIVSILYSIFEKEEQAKESAAQIIDQIDTMKKSILARAFRGELGTNDPADESAEELLKRML